MRWIAAVTEVLAAFEIWMLLAMLFGWFFARAALRLRTAPPTLAECRLPPQARAEERDPPEPQSSDAEAIRRVVRVYERT